MYVMDSIHKICGLEGVLIVYIVNPIAFRTAKTPQFWPFWGQYGLIQYGKIKRMKDLAIPRVTG